MSVLDTKSLCTEAAAFSAQVAATPQASLYGVTDGKAVGTFLEHSFRFFLQVRGYEFTAGNSALGVDFPDLLVDMKVTSIKQPQSSCPFKSARQKIYGLGYSLLVFVYDKFDNQEERTSTLRILSTVFVAAEQTADFQMTRGLLDIIRNLGNHDDLVAFMLDRNLPVEEIEANNIAAELLSRPPQQGYLTISNALQWRLQYGRVIEKAGWVAGVESVYQAKDWSNIDGEP